MGERDKHDEAATELVEVWLNTWDNSVNESAEEDLIATLADKFRAAAERDAELRCEVERLRNDLSDAEDLRAGHWPTVFTDMANEIAALRLAWAEAEARARKLANKIQHDSHYINGASHLCGGNSTGKDCERKEWKDSDWLAEVLREIGFKEDADPTL